LLSTPFIMTLVWASLYRLFTELMKEFGRFIFWRTLYQYILCLSPHTLSLSTNAKAFLPVPSQPLKPQTALHELTRYSKSCN
jgi:hypothetical protein